MLQLHNVLPRNTRAQVSLLPQQRFLRRIDFPCKVVCAWL
jgi:hypothetical protein